MAHAEGRTCEEMDMQMDDADEELMRLRSSLRAAEADAAISRAEAGRLRDERDETRRLYDGGLRRLRAAEERAEAAERAKDSAYRERDRVVALAARMAAILRWPTWLGRHKDKPGDPPWEDDWRNIVFIDLPSGQVSWHVHESELPLVRFLPSDFSSVAAPWDGHDTAEKYRRCDAPWPIRDLHLDLSAARSDLAAAERRAEGLAEALGELHDAVGTIVFRDVEAGRTEVVSPRETIYRATRAMVHAADVLAEAHRTARPRSEETPTNPADRWVCPECDAGVKADEDGCCVHCGADCTVEPAPAATDKETP